MVSQIIALAATVAALAGVVQWLRLPLDADPSRRIGYSAGTVAGAWLVALLAPAPVGPGYKAALVFGLTLTLLALTFQQSGFLPDYVAHGHLMWAYLVYAYGFASLTVWTWPSPWLLLPLVIAAAVYWRLYANLRDLWETVLLYTILLTATAWQALNWALQAPTTYVAWTALAAVLLIAAAHTVQAMTRFRGLSPRPAGVAFALLLVAQLPLAWSVWT